MNELFFLGLSVCLMTICSAHMCLLNPRQRGSLSGYNKPAAADCYLTTDECGGRMRNPNNMAVFQRGMNYTVVLQKNLDHHNSTNPGSFDISLHHKTDISFYTRFLTSIPDTEEPSLTLYMTDIHIPHDLQLSESPNYILEVAYTTNTIPIVFRQCADIVVIM
ncbi:uncharacterized protein LOC110443464 [Mizuhopecten yessoensis]|uniref:Uncharacterized protein n=1 Tax=Mizuhopecten yessoensis TaxID=6573 RepID=A0A210R0M2_MIZYE|nr:uncharacterized protein LOC110443464 [Mizuhopecten yessoensis]OWF54568.1 hypothetical protein KP79_PYT13444 [Mizuhopecten yessoensis]